MAPRSVRSTCDCGSQATFAKIGNRMGDLNSSSSWLRKARKAVAFAIVSAHQFTLRPSSGLSTVLLICKEGLCFDSEDINRLLVMMMIILLAEPTLW
jgi:hypothetical protein